MSDESHDDSKLPGAQEFGETLSRRGFLNRLKVFGLGAAAILTLGARGEAAGKTEESELSAAKPAEDENIKQAAQDDNKAEAATADGDVDADDPLRSFAQYWRRRRRRYWRRRYRWGRRYWRRSYRWRRRYWRRRYWYRRY